MSRLSILADFAKLKSGMNYNIPDRRTVMAVGAGLAYDFEESSTCWKPGCHREAAHNGYCLEHYVAHASTLYTKKMQVYRKLSTLLLPYLLTIGTRRRQYATTVISYTAS